MIILISGGYGSVVLSIKIITAGVNSLFTVDAALEVN